MHSTFVLFFYVKRTHLGAMRDVITVQMENMENKTPFADCALTVRVFFALAKYVWAFISLCRSRSKDRAQRLPATQLMRFGSKTSGGRGEN